MNLRITLLGTGGSAGVPLIGGADGAGDWGECDPTEPRNRRTRASILIQGPEHDGERSTLLVDTSPDMRSQLLDCRVKRADAILFTHAHADHITGLDDVRILNRIAGRPLDAFSSQATLDELLARYGYAFLPWKPPGFFRPVMVPRSVAPGELVEVGDLKLTVFDQDHGFTRSLGLRCGGFGYSTDAVTLDDAAFAALEGVDTWVVGCFQRQPHRTHAWLDRVYEWTERVRPRRTILTHMGQDMDWAWLVANLPPGIEPGFDGQVIEAPMSAEPR
jgi:phosphoribosyl 1,2-cyclic phosphate phosphodiesterase